MFVFIVIFSVFSVQPGVESSQCCSGHHLKGCRTEHQPGGCFVSQLRLAKPLLSGAYTVVLLSARSVFFFDRKEHITCYADATAELCVTPHSSGLIVLQLRR